MHSKCHSGRFDMMYITGIPVNFIFGPKLEENCILQNFPGNFKENIDPMQAKKKMKSLSFHQKPIEYKNKTILNMKWPFKMLSG